MRSLRKSILYLGLLLPLVSHCRRSESLPAPENKLSSFTIHEFKPSSGNPDWKKVDVKMDRTDGDKAPQGKTIERSAFASGKSEDLSLKIPQGRYLINLIYRDASEKIVYQACANIRNKVYDINTPTFKTDIRICLENSGNEIGTVPIVPTSDVTLTPKLDGDDDSNSGEPQGGQDKGTGPGLKAEACIKPNYGLPSSAAPASRVQYETFRGEFRLPDLARSPTNIELKAFVSSVYDSYPVFKQIYQDELGLSKRQALAFMFADMSRESASGEQWRMDLETGIGGPGHAWGPFQAAVTNFRGGGYDASIPTYTGLPIPDMSQFKDPAISTYTGMKRLADGIVRSVQEFGTGKPAKLYLLGTLADHNTGWPSSANDASWQASYGNEVLRLMQGYLYGDNLSNNRAFWTTQPDDQICR